MYSWHGTANHPPNPAAAANPRLDTSTSTATTAHTQQSQHQQSQAHAQQHQQSQYQMPQLRWLPSMMSRSPNLPHGLPTMSPNMSPNMRVGGIVSGSTAAAAVAAAASGGGQVPAHHGHHHNQHTHTHTHHRQVQAQVQPSVAPAVVDARAPVVEEIASSSESDVTDPTVARDSTISAQVDTITPTLRTGNTQARQHGLDRMTDGDNEDDDDTGAAAGGPGGDTGDTNRKHGKRLTTKEEVCLFDICNRHAGEFGQRSNLCKWWMTVTEEFTREQGHPYSWHSVRRKVEMMTKQRMKFLDELREKGGIDPEDISNPRWRNAIDSWIPTWRRWEEAEAKRIEKRDSRRPRKRKDRSWEGTATPTTTVAPGGGGVGGAAGWESTPLSTPTLDSQSSASSAMVNPSLPPPVTPLPPQNTVRLPPGFDNMFSSQPRTTPTAPAFSSPPPPPQARQQQQQQQQQQRQQHHQTPQQPGLATPSAKEEGGVMSAVLETLGKLNRHLDAASSDPRSSPLGATAKSDGLNGTRASDRRGLLNGDDVGGIVSSAIIERIKDEIRQEMRNEWRAEMERDRTVLEEKLESVQRTQEMIIQMLRQQSA